MPSPSLPDAAEAYDKFYDLAEDFVVKFGASSVGLSSERHNGTDRIYDEVDGVYVDAMRAGLKYKEVQVLAAIALVNASEVQILGKMPPDHRSYDA